MNTEHQKIICHANGPRCHGCAHYRGKTDVCEYAETAAETDYNVSNLSYKLPGSLLTVIIRDDGPLVHAGDTPSFRSVRITLTPNQLQKLKLGHAGTVNGVDIYESISQCFIEAESK